MAPGTNATDSRHGGQRAGGAGRLRRETIGILKFLREPASLTSTGGEAYLETASGRRKAVSRRVVAALSARGALAMSGGTVSRTAAGTMTLRRLLATAAEPDVDAHAAQHRDVAEITLRDGDGVERLMTIDRAESPLSRLAARTDEVGTSFLHAEDVEAGKRFLSDFERAQMRQRVTSDWSPVRVDGGASGRGSGDAMDAAGAARSRWHAALSALGRDLGPAIVDFVCHERALGDVERTRGWPQRSGRVMIRAGLEQLARHYRGELSGPSAR